MEGRKDEGKEGKERWGEGRRERGKEGREGKMEEGRKSFLILFVFKSITRHPCLFNALENSSIAVIMVQEITIFNTDAI